MKNKVWNTKNSYAARTFTAPEDPKHNNTLLLGHRATLYSQFHKQQHSTISHNEDIIASKESKFQQLKKEINRLQNSQFLSLKYRCHTEPDFPEETCPRSTGKEFMPRKKITQLQKFKMHLKNKHKHRKVSMLLDNHKVQEGKQCNYIHFLEVKDLNRNEKELSVKKKETPSIVRKYYRPQTGPQHRSMSQLNIRENEVRGRGLKSSATNRVQKQNILIYCY